MFIWEIFIWRELMSIKSDTKFNWQINKEINFELQAIRSILADTQGDSKQAADKLHMIIKQWDAKGTSDNKESV
jgi:hypothetical protein